MMMRIRLSVILFFLLSRCTFADDTLDELKAVKRIELLGGKITRDETLPSHPVVAVDLHRSKRFNDKYVHLLKSFTQLTTLNICGTAVTDEGLSEISGLHGLMVLSYNGDKITENGLAQFKKSLPRTQVNDFSPDEITAADEITRLGGLISIGGERRGSPVVSVAMKINNYQFNDTHVHWLQEFRELRMLQLNQTSITDAGLKQISELDNLTWINLTQTEITDIGLKEIAGLTRLTNLHLNETAITDEGLKQISGLKDLGILLLSKTKITDSGLREISGLTQLAYLALEGDHITDAGMKELAKLTNLKFLVLNSNDITDAGLKELDNLSKLTYLEIRNTPKITGEAIAKLKQTLPKLEIVR